MEFQEGRGYPGKLLYFHDDNLGLILNGLHNKDACDFDRAQGQEINLDNKRMKV